MAQLNDIVSEDEALGKTGTGDVVPESEALGQGDIVSEEEALGTKPAERDANTGASAWEKIKGSPIKFAVGEAEGLTRTAANIGQGVAQLMDPGPVKNTFGNFLRAQDAALKETEGPQFDPVKNTVTTHDTLARAMGNMILQRELQRERARAPGEAFSDAANELADQMGFVQDITPGPQVVGTAGKKAGEVEGTIAPAALPVVGPVTGALTAGAGSTGATFNQAFQVYKDAGYGDDEAREKARKIATSTGDASTLIFALPVGQLASLPKSTIGRLLTAAGISGTQMGADTFQSLVQAKASYNPNLTVGDILKQSGESAGFGALLGGLMHGAHEMAKGPNGEQPPQNGEQVPPSGEQVPPAPGKTGTIVPEQSPAQSPAAPIRMPGQELLKQIRQGNEPAAPAPESTNVTSQNAPEHPAMPAINKLAEAVQELKNTFSPQNQTPEAQKTGKIVPEAPAARPQDLQQNDANSNPPAAIVPEKAEQAKPTPEEWEHLLKPDVQRDLRAEGVTQENVDALLSGKKTPEQVVDEQLGITKSGGSIDARTMIVEENADGSRSIGFGPEAGPASTTPVNVGQMSHVDAIGMAREQGVERIRSILADRPSLTESPKGEKTAVAAPETETGGTAPEVADTPVTPAEKAAPLVPSETIPVEGGENPSRSAAGSFSPFKVGDKLEHDGKVKTVTKTSHNPNYVVLDGRMVSVSETRPVAEPAKAPARTKLSYTNNRPHDLIDEIEAQHGTIDPALIKEANPNWKPIGAARKIFRKGGERADVAATELSRGGLYKGDPAQVDQLGDAINDAAQARKGFRATAARENKQSTQDAAFARDVSRPGVDQRTIIADDLQPGDTLKIRGAPFKVREFEFDDDGNVKSVTMDDGAKYGTQTVEGGTEIKYDNRSLKRSTEPVVNRRTPEGTTKQRLASEGQPGEPRSRDKTIDFLNSLKIDTRGKLYMSFGLTPDMWNRLVDGVILAVRGGRKIAEAVNWAIDKFKKENPSVQFDEAGAREHFEKTPLGNLRYESPEGKPQTQAEQLKGRRAQIDERLGEIANEANKAQKKFTNLPDDLRSERFQLARERRQVTGRLLEDPDYVRELILAEESKGAEYHAAKAVGDSGRAQEIAEESLPAAGDPKTELDRVAPELQEQVRKQLEDQGLVKPMKGIPLGRTLGDLNHWLEQQKSDSPKVPLAERFNLARKLADKWSAVRDAAGMFRNRVAAAWRVSMDYLKNPPDDSDTMSLRKAHQFERQWTGMEIARWVDNIRGKVPDLSRRQAMHVWASWEERGLSQAEREAQASSVPEKFRKIFQTALKLTPGEKEISRQILADYDRKLADGMLVGFFDKAGRESYEGPLQWLVRPKEDRQYDPEKKQFAKLQTPRNPSAKLDPRAPAFTLPRQHELYEGIMAGGVPEMDIAKLTARYNADFHGSLADRGFVLGLKDALSKDGKPVVNIGGLTQTEPGGKPGQRTYFVDSSRRPQEAVAADGRPYVQQNHWALKGWKFSSVDAEGNPILVHGDFWVHPDEARWLDNVLGKSVLRDKSGPLGEWAAATDGLLKFGAQLKGAKFAGATMHAATIGKAAISHELASLLQGRAFNPFKKVDLDLTRNAELADGVYHGLELGFGSAQQYYMEGLASHGGPWKHVPGLAEFFQKTGDWTFKKVIPQIQANLYMDALEANRKRYAGKWTEAQIKSQSASQVNADVGMQNWRLLGSNPTMMDVNRALLTAPQFLLSEAKVVGQAFKAGGARQRYMLLTQAAAAYTLARILNEWLDGDPHWEAKNALNVVYHGRAYGTKFITNDLWSMMQDLFNVGNNRPGGNAFPFASGRLGPGVKTPIEAFTGNDIRTGRRIDTYFSKGVPRAAEIAARDTAQWLAPAFVEGALPGHKGMDTSFGGALGMGMLGITSHRYSAADQIYDLADKFNRSSHKPKTQLYQKQKDEQPLPESPYKKLDDLLNGGDIDAAKKEYKALIAEGHTPQNIASRYNGIFRPFTGNAARERDFKASLSPAQRKTYDEAIQGRKELRDQFNKIR